jgi:hypothetical protein
LLPGPASDQDRPKLCQQARPPAASQASLRLGDQLDFFFVEDLVDFAWLFFFVVLCALLWVVGFAADVSGAVGVVGATAGAFAAGAGAAPEGA